MHQLQSLCAIPSQNPRLCFRRSISSHHLLGCNLLRDGGDSRLHVAQSSGRKLSLHCRQSDYYGQRQRFGSSDRSSYSENSAYPPAGGGKLVCFCFYWLGIATLRSRRSGGRDFVGPSESFCWEWVTVPRRALVCCFNVFLVFSFIVSINLFPPPPSRFN